MVMPTEQGLCRKLRGGMSWSRGHGDATLLGSLLRLQPTAWLTPPPWGSHLRNTACPYPLDSFPSVQIRIWQRWAGGPGSCARGRGEALSPSLLLVMVEMVEMVLSVLPGRQSPREPCSGSNLRSLMTGPFRLLSVP